MYNKVTLLGRLGHDPEVVVSRAGKEYLHLSLATETWNGRDKVKETDWHRVRVIFQGQVAYLRDRARKGDVPHVVGRLTSYTFTPKDSTQRISVAFILAEEVHHLAPRREAESGGRDQHDNENDIPF